MPLTVTNTLSRKREPFEPLEPGHVKIYLCGPTVYGLTHVGNARSVIFFDVLRRYLKKSGYKVTYVRNYTDVDDKIINRARDEKTTPQAIAEKYTQAFNDDEKAMGVPVPDVRPKVTETIPEIILMIEGLIKNKVAYEVGGEVFYAVRKFPGYGKLSGKKIDELLSGARVEPGEQKKDPLDFSLWKPQKAADEPAWDSPWGKGRPGWHIECSAMSKKYLGESIDIHGGGMDLIHPHHENEIAQSEGCSGKPLCKYWLHVNMVTTGNEKMSKSLGNIFYTSDFLKKYSAETLRYLILSSHYRSTIDFSEKHIRDCQAALHRVYTTLGKCAAVAAKTGDAGGKVSKKGSNDKDGAASAEEKTLLDSVGGLVARSMAAMDDDLNTAKICGYLFECVRALNAYLDKKGFSPTMASEAITKTFLAAVKELSLILNLFGEDSAAFLKQLRLQVIAERGLDVKEIERLIAARNESRKKKDFAAADKIRADLQAQGVELRDSAAGSEWDVVF